MHHLARAMRWAAASTIFSSCTTASPTPLTACKPGDGGGDHAVEITKGIKQSPRQRFYILPRDRAKQDQFQQLIVRHGGGAAFHKTGAQPFAVICDVRR